jgi:5-methylcytosine-specific restriction endonuclease McrA
MNVTPETWGTVFRRDRGYCRYCGIDLLQKYSTYSSATMDHLLPKTHTARDEPENLVLSCPGCNQLLSRAHALVTVEERTAKVMEKFKDTKDWYGSLLRELRSES